MAHTASLHRGFSDTGMMRAFVYALIVHVVIVLFFAVNFRWISDSRNAGESVIKARAVILPAKPEPEPKSGKKAEPAKKIEKKIEKKKVSKKKKVDKRGKRKQQQIEQQLQEQLQKEQREAAAAAAASRAAELLEKYKAVIRQKVSRNWVRPAGVSGGMHCVVQVRLVAGGEVVSAEVIKSSGDAAFDRSVESAVYKAAPLPVPDDPDVFDYFRDIEFLFRPES